MCLRRSFLQLEVPLNEVPYKNSEPVGYGYKVLAANNATLINLNKWLTAKYSMDKGTPGGVTSDDTGVAKYWPGFHIWTNLNHAIGYYHCYKVFHDCNGGPEFYGVQYRKIVGFGENETNELIGRGDWKHCYKPCVIAHQIKYMEKLTVDVDLLKGDNYNVSKYFSF